MTFNVSSQQCVLIPLLFLVEFAGEIKDFYPVRLTNYSFTSRFGTNPIFFRLLQTKRVTLVHGQQQLLNDTYPNRYRDSLLTRVKKTGADVVLGDYVDATEPSSDGTITTRKGKQLRADLVVSCLALYDIVMIP